MVLIILVLVIRGSITGIVWSKGWIITCCFGCLWILVSLFLLAKLLFTSPCLSATPKLYGGNVIFSAATLDKLLIFCTDPFFQRASSWSVHHATKDIMVCYNTFVNICFHDCLNYWALPLECCHHFFLF